MKFLIDSMLPPATCELLSDRGHEAITPTGLGAHILPDQTLIEIAAAERWVIVTENAADFVDASNCTVVLIRKSWWPSATVASRLADALERWAVALSNPGHWPHWLEAKFR